jgi:excisionase family DNA binding protein
MFDTATGAEYMRGIGLVTCTPTFISRLMREGEIARVRVGKRYYVSKAALDGWLLRHERRAR